MESGRLVGPRNLGYSGHLPPETRSRCFSLPQNYQFEQIVAVFQRFDRFSVSFSVSGAESPRGSAGRPVAVSSGIPACPCEQVRLLQSLLAYSGPSPSPPSASPAALSGCGLASGVAGGPHRGWVIPSHSCGGTRTPAGISPRSRERSEHWVGVTGRSPPPLSLNMRRQVPRIIFRFSASYPQGNGGSTTGPIYLYGLWYLLFMDNFPAPDLSRQSGQKSGYQIVGIWVGLGCSTRCPRSWLTRAFL